MDIITQLTVTGIMVGGVYGLVALGLVVIYKSSRVLNLAHGGFLLVLSYLCWSFFEYLGLSIWLSIVLALASSIPMGLIVERLILRPLIGQPVLATIIVTLALNYFMLSLSILVWRGNLQSFPTFIPLQPVQFGPITIAQHYLWSLIVVIIFFIALLLLFMYSKQGLAMQIVSENHQVARSLGINVQGVFAQTWVTALVMAAAAGILYGALHSISNENAMIALTKALPVVLLGGLNSLPGALVGGLVVGVSETVGAWYIDPLVGGGSKDIIPLVLMLLILLIKPYGLFGWTRIERI